MPEAHGPAWSPDGKRIAFESSEPGRGTDIFVMKADGTGITNLTRTLDLSVAFSSSSPTWSPDGSQIAFTSQAVTESGSSYDIFVMNADGSAITNVTNSFPANESQPAWSSTGLIAYQHGAAIWTMRPDGTSQQDTGIDGSNPDWSPDGTKLAYSGFGYYDPAAPCCNSTNYDIFVSNADGSDPVNLTSSRGRYFWPAWSPDGTQITFESTRDADDIYCDGSTCNYEIYVIGADGTNLTRLTHNGVADRQPDWQPLDRTPPAATAPSHSLQTGAQLGSSAVPVQLSWTATDRHGIARYQLQQSKNGGSWTTLSLSPSTATQRSVNLAPGASYKFRVRALDSSGNWSQWEIGASVTAKIAQETSSSIAYSSGWTRAALSSSSGGYVKYATVGQKWARFTFTGREVAWVAPIGARGAAQIYVDGVYATTVDLQSATAKSRVVVYRQAWASSAKHILEIRVLGTSGRPRVDVDGFIVLHQ
jgi:Tol biopolymer transport system component